MGIFGNHGRAYLLKN